MSARARGNPLEPTVEQIAYDQRTLGDTDVLAWHEALNLADPPIDRDDALHAVARWHAEALDGRIRPAHVIRGAQAIAHRRAGQAKAAEVEEQRALDASTGPTADRQAQLRSVVTDIAEKLTAKYGPSNPGVIRRREWYDREQRRQRADAAPNPNYDPSRAAEVLRRGQDTA